MRLLPSGSRTAAVRSREVAIDLEDLPVTSADRDGRPPVPRPDRAGLGEQGGILLVDKRSGPTSHDVVGRCRALLGTRKVGHAGTLDPMATGLLVIAAQRCTKLLGHLALTDKTYLATIRLGIATDTDDAHGGPTAGGPPDRIAGVGDAELREAVAALTGTILQRPSAVSAIKVDGRRAYERHRAGEHVELAAREVTVHSFELTGAAQRHTVVLPSGGQPVIDVPVEVRCSTGTYVRALARDLGAALGVGGHLTALRRTTVGPFRVTDAVDVGGRGEPIDDDDRDRAIGAVIPAATAVTGLFPVRVASAEQERDLSYGRSLAADGVAGPVAVVDEGRSRLLALVQEAGEKAKPLVVFTAR